MECGAVIEEICVVSAVMECMRFVYGLSANWGAEG